jgi:hypothetical protein
MVETELRYFQNPDYFSRLVDELMRQLPEELAHFKKESFGKAWHQSDLNRLANNFGHRLAKVVSELKLGGEGAHQGFRSRTCVAQAYQAARLLEHDHRTLAYYCYKAAYVDASVLPDNDRLRAQVAAAYGCFLANHVGESKLAEKLLRKALAFEERLLHPDGLSIAFRKNNLAATLLNQRKVDEARLLLAQARETYERVAPDSVVLGLIYTNTFVALSRSEDTPPRALLGQARRIFDLNRLPPEHHYRRALARISAIPHN